jgi:hypothetical protein
LVPSYRREGGGFTPGHALPRESATLAAGPPDSHESRLLPSANDRCCQGRQPAIWIFSPTTGLLSICLADDPETGRPSADLLMLRARSQKHLVLLKKRHPVLAKAKILKSKPGLDYSWRIVVKRSVVVQVLGEMAGEVTWKNVKNQAHLNEADLGVSYVRALHGVHSAFVRAEREARAPDDEETDL